jgi:anti-sigma-K factor RskA
MKHEDYIHQHIDKAMTSLDGMQRASANPYLYTRVEARLREDKTFWNRAGSFISRPAFAVAAICLVIFMNLAIFLRDQQQPVVASTNQDDVQILASEYSISGNTIYDATAEQQ